MDVKYSRIGHECSVNDCYLIRYPEIFDHLSDSDGFFGLITLTCILRVYKTGIKCLPSFIHAANGLIGGGAFAELSPEDQIQYRVRIQKIGSVRNHRLIAWIVGYTRIAGLNLS